MTQLKEEWCPPGQGFSVDDRARVQVSSSGCGEIRDMPMSVYVSLSGGELRLSTILGNGDAFGPDGMRFFTDLEAGLRSAADTVKAMRREKPKSIW